MSTFAPREINARASQYLDSTALTARYEYLRDRHLNERDSDPLDEWEQSELRTLSVVESRGSDIPGWDDGVDLVREDAVLSYAQDRAQATFGIPVTAWPLSFVNWPAAANALRDQFTRLDIDGFPYRVIDTGADTGA